MKGIRVVDMTSALSGPFCTWLLASLGADVIKVENPTGDIVRNTPPFKDDIGVYFASVNRNKRSIKLDLKSEKGKLVLHKLLATADVFIENMRPGVRNRLGCSETTLKTINPRLITASITGFGQKGSLSDRPAYDIIVQAMSGMMSINGELNGKPTRVGFSIGDISAAMFTTIGVLQRLYERDAQGVEDSSHLDVSMLACQWACLENAFARYLNTGVVPSPIGSRHPSSTPFETYPTSDQDIVIGLGNNKDWQTFCEAIDFPELIKDPRFHEIEVRLKNRDALDEVLGAHLSKKSSNYWLETLIKHSIPCSIVENIKSISENTISEEYHAFSEIEMGKNKSKMKFIRNPLASAELIEKPAPYLGQHTREILKELDFDNSLIEELAG